jgi:repressor LexA
MPTHGELMAITRLHAAHAVSLLVGQLLDDAFLEKDATGTLLPGRFFAGLAVLGTISAGFPSPAEEELADTMSLDAGLLRMKTISPCIPRKR